LRFSDSCGASIAAVWSVAVRFGCAGSLMSSTTTPSDGPAAVLSADAGAAIDVS
jgi:hypothetical protein